MGFSALRHQFGRQVGQEFSGKRPVIGVSSKVLAKIMAPITNISHDQSPEISAEGMEHD